MDIDLNPYQVLGVPENATDQEVRSAYLELVKKYHPDRYRDNPLANLATEKLKEINEAYDTITKQRSENTASGGYNANYNNSGYNNSDYSAGYNNSGYNGGYSSGQSYGYSSELERVRRLLNANAVSEARAVLESVPTHNAEWNYLYGIALFRCGEYASARNYLNIAAQMDPSNAEYRNAANTTAAQGGRSYHTYGTERGSDGSGCCSGMSSACNCCSTLWCLDSCCECFGGDCCSCM